MKTTTNTFASPAAFGVPSTGAHALAGTTQVMWQIVVRFRGADAADKPGDPPRKSSGV